MSELEIPLLIPQASTKSIGNAIETEGLQQITMPEATEQIQSMISEKLSKIHTLLDDPREIKVTADEKALVILSEKVLIVIDRTTGERKSKSLQIENPQHLELIKSQNLVVINDKSSSKIYIYQLWNFEQIKILDCHKSNVSGIFITPDDKYLFSLIEDDEVIRWNINNFGKFDDFASEHYENATSSFDSSLIAFTYKNKLAVYSIEAISMQNEKEFDGIITQIKFAASNDIIVVAIKQYLRLINTKTLEFVQGIFPETVVTCISTYPHDDIIIAGHKTGEISLLDYKNNRPAIKMAVCNTAISKIFLSNNGQEIFTMQNDDKRKLTYTQFPQLDLWKKFERRKVFGFTPSGKLIFKFKDQLLTSDISFDYIQEVYNAEGISNVLFTRYGKIIVSCFFQIHVIYNGEDKYMDDKDMEEPICMKINQEGSLLFTGGKQKIKVWDLEQMMLQKDWKGHEEQVSCLILAQNDLKLISGSHDNTVKIWDHKNHMQTGLLKGHTSCINDLKLAEDKNLLISSSSDKTIRVWNWPLETLICTLNATADVVGIHVIKNCKFLMSASADGRISFWSMKSYTLVFYNQVQDRVKKFCVSDDDRYMAYYLGNEDSFLIGNPLVSENVTVSGPYHDYYEYLLYLKKIMALKDIPEHNPMMDQWVILPHLLTAPHFYALVNLHSYLKRSLESEFKVVESSFGETSLSIALSNKHRECRNIIIKAMIKNYKGNPFSLSSLTKECFIDLNNEGFRFLVKLYDLIYRRCNGFNLPKECSSKIVTPIFYHSNEIVPYLNNFFIDSNEKGSEKQIFFMHCIVPFNTQTGSQESIDFLKSVIESPNSDIFRTKFVQAMLNDKWKMVKFYCYSQGLLYLLYLLSLMFYIEFFIGNGAFLAVTFVLSILLSFYEIYQAVTEPMDYIEDLWNYIDASRALLIIAYAIMIWADADYDSSSTVLLLGSFLSFLRGITYFRLFTPTRYMITLLKEVFKDMLSFLVLLYYSTLSFAFIFKIIDSSNLDGSLTGYIAQSYLLDLGNYDTNTFGVAESIIFFIATMINPIIMMNLLISIIGDTHDRVQEGLEVADNKELAEMILEMETLLFWNRNVKTNIYLQTCMEDVIVEGQNWYGKVREIKLVLKQIKDAQSKGYEQISEDSKSVKDKISESEKRLIQENKQLQQQMDEMKREIVNLIKNR
ncbi:unnamed protein product [Blepharisma stoltei]|uniref:Ion transport domain-containing protein n=1 Tax=Blepharisma stoltei TaxID=1481888 RepID=A0AAU9J435_9CILI|nr:unnamed protein product [Blepharisma stoltei]